MLKLREEDLWIHWKDIPVSQTHVAKTHGKMELRWFPKNLLLHKAFHVRFSHVHTLTFFPQIHRIFCITPKVNYIFPDTVLTLFLPSLTFSVFPNPYSSFKHQDSDCVAYSEHLLWHSTSHVLSLLHVSPCVCLYYIRNTNTSNYAG